jgi:hypothetical protein
LFAALARLKGWRPTWRWPKGKPSVAPVPFDESAPSFTLKSIEVEPTKTVAAQPPTSPFANSRPATTDSLEDAVAQFSREVALVRSELSGIDERVRACSAAPTVDAVEECVADLKLTGQRLYAQQTQAIVAAQEICVDSYVASADGEGAYEVVERQTAQLRQSLAELDAWHIDPNRLDEDCRRLLDATELMMHSCDDVEQALHGATQQGNTAADPLGGQDEMNANHVHDHQLIHGVARVGRA